MALDISTFVQPVAFANTVYQTTGQAIDSAIAAGYAQWVKGVTGSLPIIQDLGNNRVKILFKPEQIPLMRKWLDIQVSGLLKSGPPPAVEYDIGSVVNMWAAKYAIPTVGGIFIAGIIAGYLIKKMRIL